MKKKERWLVFFHPDGRELGAYTIRGTFDGELEATLEELALENDINTESIEITVVTR